MESSDMEDQAADAVTQTQEQHQTTTEPSQKNPHPLLWGYLERYPGNTLVPQERYDLHRDRPVVTIGRARENTIWIPHISAFHATIRWGGVQNGVSQVTIEDLASKNKTFVDGTKIKPNMLRTLKHKTEFSFALPQVPPPGNTVMQDFRFIYHDLASPPRGVEENYQLDEELGSGCFSSVYKAYDKDGNIFAVKDKSLQFTWNQAGESVSKQQISVQREIDLMKTLAHPNVCRLREYFWNADGSLVHLVLEHLSGGDLFSFIQANEGLSERMTKHLMRQLCEALAFIHSKNIAHRDLKPENVLLTTDRPPILKIADFGLAKMVSPEARLRSICGTPMYLAPEFGLHMIYGTGYGMELDCFALGAVCYMCIAKLRPLYSDMPHGVCLMAHVTPDRRVDWQTLEECVISKDKEGYDVYFSSTGRHFVRGLLESQPERRLTMVQALQHEWLQFNQAELYPLSSTSTDTCDELTSSFQEVTVQTPKPAPGDSEAANDVAARITTIPHTSRHEHASDEVPPGLTWFKNKGRAMERQRDMLEHARQTQTLSKPTPEMLQIVQLSFSTPVEAYVQVETTPGGGNKRKYSVLAPDTATPQNIHLRQTASFSPEPEPAMKKGKSVGPDEMVASPAKNRRRR
ncbi:kinase-like domain-containing protein [Mycena haematopus]|nr:kinase-like domain-containing protein [Mycena haematopus]